MKGKKITYLLIIGVTAVWGIIFYRLYIAMTAETLEPIFSAVAKTAYFKEVNHQNEEINLDMNYRDPFSLGLNLVDPELDDSKVVVASRTMVSAIPQRTLINWPTILYKGYISNPTSKRRIAVLQVNGAEAMLAEGQSLSGLQLTRNFGDSVQVKYKNETKYIRLN